MKIRASRQTCFVALGLVVAGNLSAQFGTPEGWTSLETEHFRLYTAAEQNQAMETLRFLEGVRSFFAASPLPGADKALTPPVQVVAFRSERDYARYAVREVGDGYYVRTFSGSYIVLANIVAQDRELATHEYTHFVLDSAGLNLPLWLNEGLAEFYSTMDAGEAQITVGRPPQRSLKTIQRQPLLPWNVLFTAGTHSPYYADADKVFLFYAQSWALVHMLALDKRYAAQFPEFLSAISNGAGSLEALERTYRRPMREIEADLSAYLNQKSLPVLVLAAGQNVSAIQPKTPAAGDFQVQFALADLLAAKAATCAEGGEKLAVLSKQYPENPEPEEALGEMALSEQRKPEARTHFGMAIQRHSQNAVLYQQYAVLLQEAGATSAEVKSMLQRAVEIKPDFELARLQLGLFEADDRNFEAALHLLSSIQAVPREYEYDVYYALAQCSANLSRAADALRYASKAKQAARNDSQKNEAENLLAELATSTF